MTGRWGIITIDVRRWNRKCGLYEPEKTNSPIACLAATSAHSSVSTGYFTYRFSTSYLLDSVDWYVSYVYVGMHSDEWWWIGPSLLEVPRRSSLGYLGTYL